MLVMLSGWRGSGKDTAADYLVRKHGFIKLSFASALKDMVSEAYGIPRHYFDDRDLKEKALLQFPVHLKDGFSDHVNTYMRGEFAVVDGTAYHTPRSLCILEGSIKRSVDPNYWIKRATCGLDANKNYVIADWRYRSEFDALKDLFPLTVRINRFTNTQSLDPSERDLDTFPFQNVIQNTKTLGDLVKAIDDLLYKEAA